MYRRSIVLIGVIAAAAWIVGARIDVRQAQFDHSVHFEQVDGSAIECVHCHHDWAEAGGLASGVACRSCHLQRPELRRRLQADFHALCRSCHLSEQRSSTDEPLPVTRCSGCHRKPRAEPQRGVAGGDGA